MKDCDSKRVCANNNEVLCPDNTCKASWTKCSAINKCPMKQPFKCITGECKPVQFAELYNDDGCTAEVVCPAYKPFTCADGECVGDPMFCRVLPPCPYELPYRCKDRTCAEDETSCNKKSLCPNSQPILCSSGICAKYTFECTSLGVTKCP